MKPPSRSKQRRVAHHSHAPAQMRNHDPPHPTDRPTRTHSHPHACQALPAEPHRAARGKPPRAGSGAALHQAIRESGSGVAGHRSRGIPGRIRPDTAAIPTSRSRGNERAPGVCERRDAESFWTQAGTELPRKVVTDRDTRGQSDFGAVKVTSKKRGVFGALATPSKDTPGGYGL